MKCGKCGVESVEGDKFCVACGTPLVIPSIPKITQSEASLGQSPVRSVEAGHTKLLKLNCPSCGGALELPDNLTVAHCIYCGGKVLLDQDSVVRETRDLQRYIELCQVAVEAKNYKEAIEYCNRILEIDTKNIEAWINKAVSTFWLTTGAQDRYDEAMEYLNRASQIAPDDARIDKAREELRKLQAQWYVHLSILDDFTKNPARSMNHLLMASDFDADNVDILNRIKIVAQWFPDVKWSDKVRARIKRLYSLKGETTALNELKQELQRALAFFKVLPNIPGGIDQRPTIKNIEWLRREIATLEEQSKRGQR